MSETPAFLLYRSADHKNATGVQYVADLIDWLGWEIARGEKTALALTRERRHDDAFFITAKTEALSEILDRMRSEDPPAERELEEVFVDPATRPSTLGDKRDSRKR